MADKPAERPAERRVAVAGVIRKRDGIVVLTRVRGEDERGTFEQWWGEWLATG